MMKYRLSRILALASLLLVALSSFPAVRAAGDSLAESAASLKRQSGTGADLRTAFNAGVDDVRLMVLLSPT